MQDKFLAIGRIKRAVGLKGEVLIRAYSQVESFLKPACFFLKLKDSSFKKFLIKRYRLKAPKEAICVLEGVNDRNDAEAIEKKEIFQKESLLPQIEADEFYWYQLKGLEVVDEERGVVGRISAILETGANDILVVKNSQGEEILIPMVDEIIKEVDPIKDICLVNLPPGLIEATLLKKTKKEKKKREK